MEDLLIKFAEQSTLAGMLWFVLHSLMGRIVHSIDAMGSRIDKLTELLTRHMGEHQ